MKGKESIICKKFRTSKLCKRIFKKDQVKNQN